MNSHGQSTIAPTITLLSRKDPIMSTSSIILDGSFESSTDLSKRWRPRLHIVAPRGWINDPCAPGYDSVNDVYHLGFQWNPKDTEWGDISWGAALSQDLLAWKVSDRPSMQPSSQHDPAGVFTGCMVPTTIDGVEDGTLTAIYTSVSCLPIHYTLPYFRTSEAVALATSNDSGRTWTRHPNNPVLAEPPPDIDVTGWRDPFVAPWPAMDKLLARQGTKYDAKSLYAVVAGGIRGTTPTAFLYRMNAHALDVWQYLGPLITPGLNFCPSPRWTGDYGRNWEVSNFVSLSSEDAGVTRNFLICGVEGRLATANDKETKGTFRATNAQMWICGSLEPNQGVQMKFCFGGKLDHGTYYAGNSFWDPKSQHQIIYGWLLEDDLDAEARRWQGWAGVISLPRVLKLHVLKYVLGALSCSLQSIGSIELLPEDERSLGFTVISLCAIPDSRLSKMRGHRFPAGRNLTGNPGVSFPEPCSQWEMKLAFELNDITAKLGFSIIHSTTEYTTVSFDPTSESVVIDRSHSSSRSGTRTCQEEAPHTLFTYRLFDENGQATGKERLETLEFHVVYDCSVLQIFVNERTALTTRVYPASGTSTGVLTFIGKNRCPTSTPSSRALTCDLWPLLSPS